MLSSNVKDGVAPLYPTVTLNQCLLSEAVVSFPFEICALSRHHWNWSLVLRSSHLLTMRGHLVLICLALHPRLVLLISARLSEKIVPISEATCSDWSSPRTELFVHSLFSPVQDHSSYQVLLRPRRPWIHPRRILVVWLCILWSPLPVVSLNLQTLSTFLGRS